MFVPAMGSVVPPRERCVSLQCGQSPRVLYPFCVTPEAPESSDSRPSSPSNGPIRKTVTVVKEMFACFLLFSLNQWGYPEARGSWSSASQEWHAAPSEKPRVALGRAARSWEQNKIFPMSSPFPQEPAAPHRNPNGASAGHHSPPGPSFSCYQI